MDRLIDQSIDREIEIEMRQRYQPRLFDFSILSGPLSGGKIGPLQGGHEVLSTTMSQQVGINFLILPAKPKTLIYVCVWGGVCLLFVWPHLQHVKLPGPGIKPSPQQSPEPLQ